jgi:hypothetical protein
LQQAWNSQPAWHTVDSTNWPGRSHPSCGCAWGPDLRRKICSGWCVACCSLCAGCRRWCHPTQWEGRSRARISITGRAGLTAPSCCAWYMQCCCTCGSSALVSLPYSRLSEFLKCLLVLPCVGPTKSCFEAPFIHIIHTYSGPEDVSRFPCERRLDLSGKSPSTAKSSHPRTENLSYHSCSSNVSFSSSQASPLQRMAVFSAVLQGPRSVFALKSSAFPSKLYLYIYTLTY